ncbi:MAG: GyrI-like domain-containing protein [Chloroflexota bacterium]|nr:GyrI-like domain-containing protein [Chloroflexota bacterium]
MDPPHQGEGGVPFLSAPMRVAWYHFEGREPESIAIQTLIDWAARKGLLEDDGPPRFYGFNNPEPQFRNPVYGYEFWMVVGDDVEGDEPVQIKDAPGGLYVVAKGLEKGWEWARRHFGFWAEENGYVYDDERQWLEEHIPDRERLSQFPDLEGEERWVSIDVYLPIRWRKSSRQEGAM